MRAAALAFLLLASTALSACAAVRYSAEPMDWDRKKLGVRLNVLTLERRDESEDPDSMECLNKKALRLDLPKATSFLIDELRASGSYRDVALSSGVDWVRSGEILVQGSISYLGARSYWKYLGIMHWKVTIPSSNRVLWEGNTQNEAEKGGILNYHTSKVCSELLRQNFWQLREELAMVLPKELQYKEPRRKPKLPELDDL
jgi:hypothetical protein